MNCFKIILLIVIFFISQIQSPAMEIINKKKTGVDLNINISPAFYINFPLLENKFYLESAEIGLQCIYNDRLKVLIDMDFADIVSQDSDITSNILHNLYVQYKFSEQIKIRTGLFKIPVGEEFFFGNTERPYLDHSMSSDEMLPGWNIGIMLHGEELLSILSYAAGIFNTPAETFTEYETPYLSTAGKIALEGDCFKTLFVKCGYSVYYNFEDVLTHSLFSHIRWRFHDAQALSLFCEYMEQRFFNYYWNNGYFLFLSYRFKNWELYGTGDFFDRNTSDIDADDSIKICAGMRFYILKNKIQIGAEYAFENEYEKNDTDHEVSVIMTVVQ